MRRIESSAALSVLLAVIGCSRPDVSSPVSGASSASLGSGGSWVYMASTSGLTITAAVFDRTVSVTIEETSPLSGATITTRREYSTSFTVDDLSSTSSHHLFLAGVGPRGDDVIEAWRLPKDPGSFQFQVLAVPQLSVFEPPWRAPAERPPPRAPERRTVFRGDIGEGSILEIVADPEERFLLALVGEDEQPAAGLVPNTIYKVDLDDGSTELLWSSDTHAFLQTELDGFGALENEDLGRVYLVQTLGGPFYQIFFVDTDNDGTFESAEGLTYDEVRDAGWLGPSAWTSLSSLRGRARRLR